ncbi:unnamed protein product [Plutella xylostella]|uniref:protein-histidine N-methyltransferase n=1 Tax=Plutella xylostella TaxID=51655 RepID=A0A8S4FAP0_PLUXY|nr:unnamed protein product [Plutella xylostella]
MTSFKFNFSADEKENTETESNTVSAHTGQNIKWQESEIVKPDTQVKNLDTIAARANIFVFEDVEIGHIIPSTALSLIDKNQSDIVAAESQHSDLVTGKYEGGLKIWECTSDLIEYLENHKTEISLKDTKVLDLGCGAGLVGIYAFLNGAKVTFQDYNKEVLEHVTIPNVLLNIDEEEDREKQIAQCSFYSGDWASFMNILEESELFNFILTSETIYNSENYDKLIELFLRRLSQDGVVFVAAKTYYFGVGGGTRQFEECVSKSLKLKSEVVWLSSGGVKREIIKITRNNTN